MLRHLTHFFSPNHLYPLKTAPAATSKTRQPPARIRVENESGLSNFIPVLFADSSTCLELERIQHLSVVESDITSRCSDGGSLLGCCEAFVSRQSFTSQLVLDIAWLLKEPQMETNEHSFSSENLQRINNLLTYLKRSKSVYILRKVADNLKKQRDAVKVDISASGTQQADWNLFERTINDAIEFCDKILNDGREDFGLYGSKSTMVHQRNMESYSEDLEVKKNDGCSKTLDVTDDANEEDSPILTTRLIKRECKASDIGIRCRNEAWDRAFPRTFLNSRLIILAMFSVVVCFGFCAVLLHPHKAGDFVVSVRRCVFGAPKM